MRLYSALTALAAALTLGGSVTAAPFSYAQADAPAAKASKPAAQVKNVKKAKKVKKAKQKEGKTGTLDAPSAVNASPSQPPAPTMVIIKQPTIAPTIAPTAAEVNANATPKPNPAALGDESDYAGPPDDDAPVIAHTPVAKALKGRALTITARISDLAGVFQPVLYLRKAGTFDYIPLKMNASKTVAGDYWVELDPRLVYLDLEYYLESWDLAGNGPARAGSPGEPFAIKVEEEKKAPVASPETIKIKGAPPGISHSAIAAGVKGNPIEISAKLIGDTGVSAAKVMFRRVGDKDFKELPMGDLGENNYTATVPASMVQDDLEYYLEAFDKHGNGPGRSGAPTAPYKIVVTEKMDATKIIIAEAHTSAASGPTPPHVAATPALPPAPRLVKLGFTPNVGRWLGYLAIGGFVGGLTFAGGEAYGAYQANEVYKHTFTYDGRLEPLLLDRANAYGRRAKIFGLAAVGSLVVGVTLLLIFPDKSDTLVVAGSGGDLVLANF